MDTIILRHLELSDKEKFLTALNDDWEVSFVFAHYFESLAEFSFEKYLKVLPQIAKGELIPEDHVPSTLLFAFNQADELVGRISIRHHLNQALMTAGGHVGYGVVPSQRRKGYAQEILKTALKFIRIEMNSLQRILVTCDESNVASQKTIERNGGMLENVVSNKKRYWISLT